MTFFFSARARAAGGLCVALMLARFFHSAHTEHMVADTFSVDGGEEKTVLCCCPLTPPVRLTYYLAAQPVLRIPRDRHQWNKQEDIGGPRHSIENLPS